MVLALLIAFLLELIAFFSFAAVAFLAGMNITLKIAVYVILLSLVVGFWAIYMSPRAPRKLNAIKYYLAKGIVYLVSALALYNLISPLVAIVFVIVWLTDELLILKLRPKSSLF